jgi:hypothetical protein
MEDESGRQMIVAIARSTNESEKMALASWAQRLLEIRGQDISKIRKAKLAVQETAQRGIIIPAIKILARDIKKYGWDERSKAGRFGLAGAGIGVALFGGQGAGIAALGTAIGVPLWVVIGSGAAFAGVLVEEFGRRGRNRPE